MRTVEQIKQYYEALRESFKSTNSSDEWVGEPIKEMWMILDHIAELEAQNAALQAQVGAWQGVEVVPPTQFQKTINGREVINSEEVDILARVRAFRQELRFHDGNKNIEWVSHHLNAVFPHDRVLGWRPRPDESPTAAESEE